VRARARARSYYKKWRHKFRQKFSDVPVPDRRAVEKYGKMIKQQVPVWAVRQHAEDAC